MPRPSDKWFHLTVSVFALGLTAVSATTLVYERSPEKLASWIHSLMPSHPKQLTTTTTTNHQTTPPKAPADSTGSNSLGSRGEAAPSGSSNTSVPQVSVKPFGTDVPGDKILLVDQLLAKQNIVQTVSQTLQLQMKRPVHIYLAQNAADYKKALSSLGVSMEDAQRYSHDTGGFTMGADIVIPLYQNHTTPDLANTLAHELTHTYLNDNIHNLPSWMNEGLAVYLGMKVQRAVQDPVDYGGYARQMAESVVDAAKAKTLVPLTEDESAVLSGKAPYDLELQDWLAVSQLMDERGIGGFSEYFQRLNKGSSADEAFRDSFGTTFYQYNQSFTTFLTNTAADKDQGVVITLTNDGTFTGYVRILQHGTSVWHGVPLADKSTTVTLAPDGTLQGYNGPMQSTKDRNAPDKMTTYVDLDPTKPLKYKGKAVDYCGFAIDYHYGLYGFVNAWITYKDGTSEYLQSPTLFGVKLQDVAEASDASPMLALLNGAGGNNK